MSGLRFDLHAAAVLAPGLASLADLRRASRAGQPPAEAAPLALPSPAVLPANERRRASTVVRLTLSCIEQALQASPFAVESLRSVFATDEGTGEVCQQMLEAMATTRQVSPLVFTNSVQNAPSGNFAIAWRNRQSATVASLGLESFASGLLCALTEAAATQQPVLLVAYDPAMTAPLDELLPVTEPVATAWILSAGSTRRDAPVLGSFAFELGPAGIERPSPLPPWLPPRWAAFSSARALAALGLLESAPGTVLRLTLASTLLSLRRIDEGAA
jgi:hypothetical protein